MTVPFDPAAELQEYARPERLVTTAWVAEHAGTPGLVVVESDEDVLLYEVGHIAGAIKIDWHTDLNDPVTRDFIDPAAFQAMMSAKGISRDDTIVIYGDKSNWWAAYALWVFTLYGHEDVRLMNGGRDKWIEEGRELVRETPTPTPSEYPLVERDDETERAFRGDVVANFGKPLFDVRSPEEYRGERTTAPAYPEESTLRAGHVPTAHNVPWGQAAREDQTFKSRAELEVLYREKAGLRDEDEIIAYCRIGERSSHTWFVLRYLLGFENVRNYDGSWLEWGSLVRMPIEKSDQPGTPAFVPAARSL
ncbi:sulfurtransferase [Leucobacter sp. M11]|uniref:sulfurtransferase n=1 Tax=Leucobacter sp. M11 TaxID=2993565 RepID=UPI002D7E9D63|nr:sulfurtransferase [Leucobacter sp. M11]MEB4616190.1 sulfurtransferase [Leucobacter sp. M11]